MMWRYWLYFNIIFGFVANAQQHSIFSADQFEKIKINENAKLDHVISLEKDVYGFLWIGESNGLFRFDGDRPTKIDLPENLGERMRMLHFKNHDTLLIATNKGLGIVNIKSFNTESKFFTSQDSNYFLEDNFIRGIVAGKNNTTWIFTKTAIHLLDKNLEVVGSSFFKKHPEIIDANPIRPHCFPISEKRLITKAVINTDSSKKNTWDLIDIENNTKSRIEIPILEVFNVRACHQIDTNQFLLTSDETDNRPQAFYLFDYNKNTLKKILDYDSTDEVTKKVNLTSGNHSEGINFFRFKTGYFYNISKEQITEEYRNFKPYTVYVKMDDGVVYAGSSEGLFRLTPSQLHIETPKAFIDFFEEKKFNDQIMDFYKDENTLYIATHRQHIFTYDSVQKSIKQLKLSESRRSGLVWNLRKDKEGFLFVGTQDGLFVLNTKTSKAHRWEQPDLPNSLSHVPITTQFTDSQNILWMGLGDGNGLLQIDLNTNKIVHHHFDKNKFPLRSVLGITEDIQGNIWLGYSTGGGLIKWDRKANSFSKLKVSVESVFTTDRIYSLLFDRNNLLWIGTRYGLFSFNIDTEKFKKYTVNDGLPDNYINKLYQDINGNIWIGTANGLSIYNTKNKTFKNFDKSQGLPGSRIQCIKPWNDNESKLFVGAENGFCIIDVEYSINNNSEEALYIEPIKINNQIIDIDFDKTIELNHNKNNLAINFGVINHNEGRRNKYYYKVNERDTSWIELKSRGELQLIGLGTGKHTVQVRTCINGSNCYKSSYLSFEVLPPFYKTWWFFTSLILIAVTLTMLFYRAKIAHIKRMEAIRSQISSDLHDDVGASISSVRILTDFLDDKNTSEEEKKSLIQSIKEQSQHIGNVLEEIVWNISPKNDVLENVVHRMQLYANETLEQSGITVHSYTNLSQPNLLIRSEKRKELYLLLKEAINNVLKHSKCNNVWIKIDESNSNLSLMIKDDGIGFDTSKSYQSNGLLSMKKRTEKLNGILKINSTKTKGTTVSFKATL